MDTTAIIVILALIAGALVLVLYPLWQHTRTQNHLPQPAGQTLEEYQVRYQASLAAIKDLMFDYEMGKMTESDYQILLAKVKVEAAQIRKQLDALNNGNVITDPATEAKIEAMVAQMRDDGLNVNGNQTISAEIEADIERLKNIGAAGMPACPVCGRAYEVGDAFCAGCGHALDDVPPVVDEDTCPRCGYVFSPDDAFCAKCGAQVSSTPQLAEVPA